MSQVAVIDEVRSAITKMAPQFKAALPAHVSVEKFQRVVMTSLQMNPDIMNTDRRTLFMAATRAAQMGLLPDGREGAIVKFGNQAQFMPMIGGILKLVRNSGEIASIDAQVVYEQDAFKYRPGIDEVPVFEPDWFADRGAMKGAYAVARMKDGSAYVEVMSMKQIDQVRQVSRSRDSGPWKAWPDEMARKTVLRRLAKRLPSSTDLDGALDADDELFQPPVQQPPVQQENQPEPVAPASPESHKRASRLDAVAEQAPADVQDVHYRDVSDVGDAQEHAGDDSGDSPI